MRQNTLFSHQKNRKCLWQGAQPPSQTCFAVGKGYHSPNLTHQVPTCVLYVQCADDAAAVMTTTDVGEMLRKSRPPLTQPKGTLPYVVSD